MRDVGMRRAKVNENYMVRLAYAMKSTKCD